MHSSAIAATAMVSALHLVACRGRERIESTSHAAANAPAVATAESFQHDDAERAAVPAASAIPGKAPAPAGDALADASTCPRDLPSGTCSIPDETCTYGATSCRCAPPCVGMLRPDAGRVLRWSCGPTPSPDCPPKAPVRGAACPRVGLVCKYGTCGGQSARCKADGWDVVAVPPPP
jgi:hypothetical protein